VDTSAQATSNILEWGIAGGFAVLVLGLLTKTLQNAAEERKVWMEQIRSEGAENRAALRGLSDVLIEMKTMLQAKNGGQ
jgi:hypothetical protein